MYTCGVKGPMEGVGGMGSVRTLAGRWRGGSTMEQFNADMGVDLIGIRVHASNNCPSIALICLVNFFIE
jgi:hypothetical protein